MALAYFVVALTGTWVNFLALHLTGIGYFDLSINQQALSSTIHSNRPYPFYEAINCGRDGRCSFLLVHPVFLAYGVALPYALWPSPFTLFAIQDLALALAALPLYAIARIVTRSYRLSLVVAAVYLVWLPSFSGIFSFHWEAFIPLEFFLVFWLWLVHRYRWAIPVVIVSFITLEVAPILLFFFAVFFLLPWVRPALRFLRKEFGQLVDGNEPRLKHLRALPGRLRSTVFADARFVASVALLFGSVVGYLLLHEFVTQGGFLLGLPALPAKYVLPVSRPVYASVFTFQSFIAAWQSKLVFWLVIYGTLAAIPFLAPRTLVLAVPWILFSDFATPGYWRMGDQYAFVTSAVIFIGFLYGVAQLKEWSESGHGQPTAGAASTPSAAPISPAGGPVAEGQAMSGPRSQPGSPAPATAQSAPGREDASAGAVPTTPGRWTRPPSSLRAKRRRRVRVAVGAILVAVVAFNLFLNPLNPLAAPLKTDRPFVPQSSLGLEGGLDTTDFNHLEKLLSLVGPRTIVAVSPMLFPFVANDPYAYPLLSKMNLTYLPYAALNGTEYVLLLDRGGTTMNATLAQEIDNTSMFGVRAWIPSTYIGGVLLFERGYFGPAETIGAAPPAIAGTFTGGAGLLPGSAGTLSPDATSLSGTVVTSSLDPEQAGLRQVGPVFSGPDMTLVSGSYEVTVVLNGSLTVNNPDVITNATTPVVTIVMAGFQYPVERTNLRFSSFGAPGWTDFTFNITLPYPVLSFRLTGIDNYYWFGLGVNYVSIVPISGT